jgi:hypothetical protein
VAGDVDLDDDHADEAELFGDDVSVDGGVVSDADGGVVSDADGGVRSGTDVALGGGVGSDVDGGVGSGTDVAAGDEESADKAAVAASGVVVVAGGTEVDSTLVAAAVVIGGDVDEDGKPVGETYEPPPGDSLDGDRPPAIILTPDDVRATEHPAEQHDDGAPDDARPESEPTAPRSAGLGPKFDDGAAESDLGPETR